jgi:hypothetical protein
LRPASSPLPALALVIFSGIVSHFSFSGWPWTVIQLAMSHIQLGLQECSTTSSSFAYLQIILLWIFLCVCVCVCVCVRERERERDRETERQRERECVLNSLEYSCAFLLVLCAHTSNEIIHRMELLGQSICASWTWVHITKLFFFWDRVSLFLRQFSGCLELLSSYSSLPSARIRGM